MCVSGLIFGVVKRQGAGMVHVAIKCHAGPLLDFIKEVSHEEIVDWYGVYGVGSGFGRHGCQWRGQG